ncbi:MAG: hypothetical protein AAB152_13200 [Candidatus Coatesbacteria bacterium]
MPLHVETGFPMANATAIGVGDRDGHPEVAFTPDPHGGPEALWFYFRLVREGPEPRAGDLVRLVLKHPENMLGGACPEKIRPVVRAAAGDWERLPEGRREELPDGRLRMVWMIPAPADSLEVAACYPYGHPDLVDLVRETRWYWRVATIGVSQGGRGIVRIANDPGTPGSTRPGFYLVARQHSGETTGSWVLDGFLRYVAAHPERAPLVWAVPFANIDGVEQGDYGKDNFPYDLNRAWGDPPMRHETVVIQRDLARWKARCRPELGLDFHSPGACEAEGVYAFLPDPGKFPLEHREAERWTALLAGALVPEFAAAQVEQVPYYTSRWTTPDFTTYCFDKLQVPGLTVETPYALCNTTVMTRELYRQVGSRIAAAVCRAVVAGGG